MAVPIYLDHNATTPLAAEVVEVMVECLAHDFGNPSSGHAIGAAARERVDRARQEVADLLCCEPDEVVFTSGGTESDNWAIFGVLAEAGPDRQHVVTSNVEHPAIEVACAEHERRGGAVTRVPVDSDGSVRAADVAAAIRPDTALVTIMQANSETGTLQPITEIVEQCRAHENVVVHTDASQAAGKVSVSVAELGVDLLTLAGHKLCAPKGIGVLYVRRGTELANWFFGGGHESGRRAGTENVASIAGLGVACRLAREEAAERRERMTELRDRLHRGLAAACGEVVLNGPEAGRLPNTLNLSFPGAPSHQVMARLDGVCVSAGSACHAGSAEPSAVLMAMGMDSARALAALRLSLGRGTTEEEIDGAIERIARAVAAVRA